MTKEKVTSIKMKFNFIGIREETLSTEVTISNDDESLVDFFKNDFQKYLSYEELLKKILDDFTKDELVTVYVLCQIADLPKEDITEEVINDWYDYYYNEHYETKDEAIKELVGKAELCKFVKEGAEKLGC